MGYTKTLQKRMEKIREATIAGEDHGYDEDQVAEAIEAFEQYQDECDAAVAFGLGQEDLEA